MTIRTKKIISSAIAAIFLFVFIVPRTTHAEIPGFSGYPAFTPIPCTCSATLWSFFAPLYLSEIPMVGPMVYVPYATVPYPYFTPTLPTAPHFGAYLPGVQACWMYVGLACVIIPSIGSMLYVSTGVPGAYGL